MAKKKKWTEIHLKAENNLIPEYVFNFDGEIGLIRIKGVLFLMFKEFSVGKTKIDFWQTTAYDEAPDWRDVIEQIAFKKGDKFSIDLDGWTTVKEIFIYYTKDI